MPSILPAAPYARGGPVFNGRRETIWRGLLYTPGGDGDGPRVQPARLDTIRVERDGRRLATGHGTRRVLVITGPARCAVSTAELLSAISAPLAHVTEHGDRASGGENADHRRLAKPLRDVSDIDRAFTLARSPKTAAIAPRCPHCRRFEPCPCDCR